MASTHFVPVTEAREKLSGIIDSLEESTVMLVRHSRPAAVMVSPARYEALLDQIEHLEDQCSVLYAQLHPEKTVSLDKVKAELGLLS